MISDRAGEGKTTSTFNIAAGLSLLTKGRVLMIDLDPQCSLTNICLKAYSTLCQKEHRIEELDLGKTLNGVIRSYLRQSTHGIEPAAELADIVLAAFYPDVDGTAVAGLDIIPATMFDTLGGYARGLDDLEIELSMLSQLHQLSIFAQFFTDAGVCDAYDYVLFDCPPVYSRLTQNALIVSDYYIIPTIMCDLSSSRIAHLCSLIHNTLFGFLRETYSGLPTRASGYLKYIVKPRAELLGAFETMRKPRANVSSARMAVNNTLGPKLCKSVIYYDMDTARSTGLGQSVFSTSGAKGTQSPFLCYGRMVLELLDKMEVAYDRPSAVERIREWL